MDNPVLTASRAKRAKFTAKMDELLAAPTAETRSLTDAEATEFEELAAKISKLDSQIDMLAADEARKATAMAAVAEIIPEATPAPVRVTSEPMTYNARSKASWLQDMTAISLPQAGFNVAEAQARLARHGKEMEVEARTNKDIAYRLESAMEERATDSLAGYGGDLIAPLYLIDSFVPIFRAGRPAANRVTNLPLPAGTNSINIPKLVVGTQVAAQAAPTTSTLAGVNVQDVTTGTVNAPVNTYAGQTDVALQLIEQSSANIDQVILQDLSASYDQVLDQAILTGSGASGQHQGILTYAATVAGSVVYTGANTVTAFTGKGSTLGSIINGVNNIETTRFANATGIWVHPRRANAFGAAQDTTGRPVFVRQGHGAFNALGIDVDSPQFQSVAGELYGLPVIKDANMPSDWISTTGAVVTTHTTGATAQDVMLVLKEDDIYLWEGPLRLRVLPEVSSGTLAVRLQAYAYSAFMPNRTPTAISMITGPALQTSILGY
jgi:HK97 family phage major capsid protein